MSNKQFVYADHAIFSTSKVCCPGILSAKKILFNYLACCKPNKHIICCIYWYWYN